MEKVNYRGGVKIRDTHTRSVSKNYLQSKGYKNILDYTVSKNISSSESSTILQTAKNYDQIAGKINIKGNKYTTLKVEFY